MNADAPVLRILKSDSYPECHHGKWQISFNSLEYLLSHEFTQTYHTLCESFQSTWVLSMSFEEIRGDGTAKMYVYFRKANGPTTDRDVTLWVEICDNTGSPIFPKQRFMRVNVSVGDIVGGRVEMASYPNIAGAIYRNAVVILTLCIKPQ